MKVYMRKRLEVGTVVDSGAVYLSHALSAIVGYVQGVLLLLMQVFMESFRPPGLLMLMGSWLAMGGGEPLLGVMQCPLSCQQLRIDNSNTQTLQCAHVMAVLTFTSHLPVHLLAHIALHCSFLVLFFTENGFPVTLVARGWLRFSKQFFVWELFFLGGLFSWLAFEFRSLRQVVSTTRNVAAPPPRPVAATTGPSSATPKTATRHTKDPPVFDGNAALFKEWAFAVDIALRALDFQDASVEVDYAAGYLTGNARLWLMAALEAGTEFENWPALKDALADVYGPMFDPEQIRLCLFSLQQRGTLDDYIREFSRLSLQVPDLDEHSRAVLFVNGLSSELRGPVLKEHPSTLGEAIKASKAAERCGQMSERWTEVRPRPRSPRRSQLTADDRNRMRQEGRCFACRRFGHIARNCSRSQPSPNDPRQ